MTQSVLRNQVGDLLIPAAVVGAIAGAIIYCVGWGLAAHLTSGDHSRFDFKQGGQAAIASIIPIPGMPGIGVKHQFSVYLHNQHPFGLMALEYSPWFGGGLMGLGAYLLLLSSISASCRDRHVSGRKLLLGKTALREWRIAEGPEADGLKVHPTLPAITLDRETRHFLIFGGVGSGKTQTILPLMHAAQERGDKSLIFDNKGDFTSFLSPRQITRDGKAFEIHPLIFAPWDQRSPVWAIAEDVNKLTAAREFAARMVPQSKDGNPMWSNAARQILTGCLVELQTEKPGQWSFNDLVSKLTRPLDQVTRAARIYFPESVKALGDGFENVTTSGIQINLMSYLSLIFDLARAWPNAPAPQRGLSLKRWLMLENTDYKTIILQSNGEIEGLSKAFNGAVISLMSQLINSPRIGESRTRKLWVFLDEFKQLGRVEPVFTLAEIGRSKGIRLVIGVQDISQLKEVYGEHITNSLVSMVGTQIVTRVSGGETADFISESLIGCKDVDRLECSQTRAVGSVKGTQTCAWRRVPNVPVMPPNELGSRLGLFKKKGVRVLWLGVGDDALITLLSRTSTPTQRPASILAEWVNYPRPSNEIPPVPTPTVNSDASTAHKNTNPSDILDAHTDETKTIVSDSNPQPLIREIIVTALAPVRSEMVVDKTDDAAEIIGKAVDIEMLPVEAQGVAHVLETLLDAIDATSQPALQVDVAMNPTSQPQPAPKKRRLVKIKKSQIQTHQEEAP